MNFAFRSFFRPGFAILRLAPLYFAVALRALASPAGLGHVSQRAGLLLAFFFFSLFLRAKKQEICISF